MREQNDPSKLPGVPPPCGPGVPDKVPQRRHDDPSRNRPNIDGRLSDDRTGIDPVDTEPATEKTGRQASKPRDVNDLT